MTEIKKLTATEQAFEEYKTYIIAQLLEFQHSLSYATAESLADWPATLPYDQATMESLLKTSITFICTLTDRDFNHINPNFLQALTLKIAKYLSNYKIKSDPRIKSGQQLSEITLRKMRTNAKEFLQYQLYNCKYITLVLARLKAQRAQPSTSKKHRKKTNALRKYKISRQVSAEFATAQNTPRVR